MCRAYVLMAFPNLLLQLCHCCILALSHCQIFWALLLYSHLKLQSSKLERTFIWVGEVCVLNPPEERVRDAGQVLILSLLQKFLISSTFSISSAVKLSRCQDFPKSSVQIGKKILKTFLPFSLLWCNVQEQQQQASHAGLPFGLCSRMKAAAKVQSELSWRRRGRRPSQQGWKRFSFMACQLISIVARSRKKKD